MVEELQQTATVSVDSVPAAVVERCACVICGFGYDGPGAAKCALDAGMIRTAEGWVHSECLAEGK